MKYFGQPLENINAEITLPIPSALPPINSTPPTYWQLMGINNPQDGQKHRLKVLAAVGIAAYLGHTVGNSQGHPTIGAFVGGALPIYALGKFQLAMNAGGPITDPWLLGLLNIIPTA